MDKWKTQMRPPHTPSARPREMHLAAGWEQVPWEPFSYPLLVVLPLGDQNYLTNNTLKHVISFLGSLNFKDADFFLYYYKK